MLRARLCRQAQTWGLTYWTVLIPAERRSRARRRLNSGASIPTNTSGLAARNEARMRARRRSRRGRSRTISNKPITASDSAGSQTAHPAACIFGPATPKNSVSGERRRSAWIRSAPSVSPDASPATKPTRSGADIASRNEQRKARCSCYRTMLQGVRAVFVRDLLGGDPPPLQAYRVDAVRHRRASHRQHIGRNVASHHGVVRNETVRADLGVLMHGRQAAQGRPIADFHVPAERGAIRHHDLVAETAVMSHVRIRHQQIVVADERHPSVVGGAAIHRDGFAKYVAVADFE